MAATTTEALQDLADEKLFEELENEEIPAHIKAARFDVLKQQANRFQVMNETGHGIYSELSSEKEFLDLTTSEDHCIVHFYHNDFRRCAILDTHLKKLTEKYHDAKFAKINVEKTKFLVERLKIRVLPAVLCFRKGIVVDRVVGFGELGETDDFETSVLEKRLARSGIITMDEEDIKKRQYLVSAILKQMTVMKMIFNHT